MDIQYKKLAKSGAVTIPVNIRREMAMEPGDGISLEEKDGGILMKPFQYRCQICKGLEDVRIIKGKGLCLACASEAVNQSAEGGR